ncbi:TrmB family transcriptional regulator [Natrinema halophilum]|uniref:TrmB family transcriptional regulator n=1 Tax=Natrinema halophilum TaxID=1699371 RepID=A0A7D5GJA1_9EURY|nr:TrmB family transcriptional regulator [Natrinema halophilum]QLG47672.1 TrmB family transcriptional regulator [Natrinema halophilum]
MSTRDAVTALKRLGLPNYQARTFVALQQLGTGTAQEISDVSDVPRSQVYGAADDLAERGLVEVTESSPKEYRPVSLATAREQLTNRLERERERAFDNLAQLRTAPSARGDDQSVSTLRGRQPIDDRIAKLVESADSRVVFVAPEASSLSEQIETKLREQAARGMFVTVVTAEESERPRFSESSITVIVMGEDNPADFAGRALMIDDRTVLLSVATDDDTVDEEAMWTAGSRIGRILTQFMQSGIESGRERNP